ncbi:holin, partial [Listeria monocytogenes]|nr:holin [Listeria monocytogenes]EAH2240469.1 holin [Listeria monocytogenes]EAH3326834.1 holin [Listeria monocytogenes]EJQ0879909.1 holin [Listeria monocytogenes]EJQ2133183.1 holin [Listeria monocytogenes]
FEQFTNRAKKYGKDD